MALSKTLRLLSRNPNHKPLSFFPSSNPFPALPHPSPLPHLSHPFVAAPNPFSSLLRLPFAGPLFLSLPPWKLSQSATPLYLRGKERIFPMDLLPRKRYPPELGFAGSVSNPVGLKEKRAPLSCDGEARGIRVEDSFLNLPNLVSISRMLSGPLIGWMIINEWYFPSFCALVISGTTDWLDGFLARKMNIDSVFGSYLDPLADKVLIGCVALAMVEKGLLHPGLVGLVVLRDVGLVGGVVYRRASSLGWKWNSWSDFVNLNGTHREKVEPLLISKMNTVFQLLLVAAALLQPEFGSEHTQLYINYLSWLVASTTIASAVGYGVLLRNRSAAIGKWRSN